MKILAAQIEVVRVLPEEFKRGFEHREDLTAILKRYWNHDAFRNFKVYDLQKLDTGEKVILDVSQEQIISDIVQQVENCMNGNEVQDILVTAPSGAGKSVIFQIPAIYLAEKYNLLTIVISPLIGLMTDQVKNLELKNYRQAATINSDISPILKDQIVEKIAAGERAEFELEKFPDLENAVKRAKIFDRKTLIYFPEVQLIETAKYLLQKENTVAVFHGKLNRDDKRENYEKFLRGEALYHYDKKDFKYIKRLHGLSAIKKYQLVAVVKKIYELWSFKRKNNLLLDAENFTYIFDRHNDEATSINKVKTALLIIQKDFEARPGFSPLTVRPIPLFAVGFFVINPSVQKYLLRDFGECLKEIEPILHIFRVNLQMIWEKNFYRKGRPLFAQNTYPNGQVCYRFSRAMKFYFA